MVMYKIDRRGGGFKNRILGQTQTNYGPSAAATTGMKILLWEIIIKSVYLPEKWKSG